MKISTPGLLCLVFFLSLILSFDKINAADHYWVGGAGAWDASSTAHWSLTSGGANGASVPASGDNVFFDANSFSSSGQTVSININAVCNNMDWTGAGAMAPVVAYSGTNTVVHIYGTLILSAGMVFNNYSNVEFDASSGTNTITTNGVQIKGSITFGNASSSGATWQLQDELTSITAGVSNMTLSYGTLNTNDQTMNLYQFNSNSGGLRVLNLGSSSINIIGILGNWNINNGNGLTVNAGTSTINFNLSAANTNGTFRGGNQTYNNVSFNTGSASFYDANTFNNLNLSSPGSNYSFQGGVIQTITGSFGTPGITCGYVTPISVKSITPGTQATISHSSGADTLSWVKLTDINATGGASFTAVNAVDLGNNTGWTINAQIPRNMYWVGGAGNWNDVNHWATGSGGATLHTCIPTPMDNVFFDANSFSSAGQIVNVNATPVTCNNMDWTGSGSMAPVLSSSSLIVMKIYGSLTLASGVVFGGVSYPYIEFDATSGINTITSNGAPFKTQITFGNSSSSGATWQLQDALTCSTFALANVTLAYGTLNTNNQTMNLWQFNSNNSNTRTLNLGSSTINLISASSGTGAWNINGTNLILNAGTSSINFNNGSNSWTTLFTGGGKVYNNVTWILGNATFNDANTFNNLTLSSAGATYQFTAGTTQTITGSFNAGSCAGALVVMKSTSPPTQATISMSSGGTVTVNRASIQAINATGGATFTATNSTDAGNNSGWTFPAPTGRNLYWVGGSGNWNDISHWAMSSGGTGGSGVCSVPASEQDNVFFDANSFSGSGQTVTLNVNPVTCNNMDWTGSAAMTPNLTWSGTNTILHIYGSLTLNSGLALSNYSHMKFDAVSGTKLITTYGVQIKGNITFGTSLSAAATWQLQDSLNCNAFVISSLTLSYGTLNTNNQTVNLYQFASGTAGNTNRTLNLGSSTVNIQSIGCCGGPIWNITNSGNFTLNAGASNINFTTGPSGATYASTFNGGGKNYNNVSFLTGGGTFNDANTYNNLSLLSPGSTFTLASGVTQTINAALTITGTLSKNITVKSGTAGVPATFSKSNGEVCADYMILKDNTATGGAIFNGGANSTDGGGNSGWTFPGNCTVHVNDIANVGDFSVNNIYPNPASEAISFYIYMKESGVVHLEILDYSGRIIIDEIQNVNAGKSRITTQMNSLAPGVYSLKAISRSGFFIVNKIIKL